MPETFRTLVSRQSLDVAAQLFEQERAVGMVFRAGRRAVRSWSVWPIRWHVPNGRWAAAPVLPRSRDGKAPFRDKHAVDELSADLGRLVEISCRFLLFINATISQRRDSHEHVVQPDGVVLRAVACECAVGQAVLSVFDESEIIFYQVGQRQGRVGDTRLHHGTTHGSGIVQCFRVQDLFHLCVGIFVLFVKLAESRSDFGQEFETADDVILVSVISRHFGGIQQCLISHAPFIAPDAERAPVECGAVGECAGSRSLLCRRRPIRVREYAAQCRRIPGRCPS